MKWPVLKCPFCGGVLRNTELHTGPPFVCPSCGAELQYSRRELWLSGFIALCLTVAVLYLLGLRASRLVIATIVLWFPIDVAWEFIFVRIGPPSFEAYVPRESKSGIFRK